MPRIITRVAACTAALTLMPAAAAVASETATTSTVTTTSAVSATVSATATTTTTTTTTTVAPKPKKGSIKLYLPGGFVLNGGLVTIPGRPVSVEGVVRPFVSGQWVTFKAYLGKRLIKSDRYRLKPSPKRNYGRFSVRLVSPGTGYVTVEITHAATSQLSRIYGQRTYAVLDPHVGFGSTGRFVQLMQQRLAARHIWLPQSGVYDSYMGLAIDAYHRLLHWGTYQSLDSRTITWLLNGWGDFRVRYPKHGDHAEGNLGVQLLALIRGSKVQFIFPISSGKPSTPTVLGNFHVYSRVPGYLPDGMYYSSFFIGGYAIHGYDPAPDYPASHGCMRLPIQDAVFVYNWLNYGDAVDVYY